MHALPVGVTEKSQLPIIVHIGRIRAAPRQARDEADRFCCSLRRVVRATAGSLKKIRSGFSAGRLTIHIHRLDPNHGEVVRDDLFRRVRRSDLVILDVTAGRPEAICAISDIMAARGKSASLFLLHEAGAPGDFTNGGVLPDQPGSFSMTRYERCVSRGRAALRLVEPRGFAAALGSSLLAAARERGCWG